MQLECGVTTEKGNVRSRNEDKYLIGHLRLPAEIDHDSRRVILQRPCILAVCDGMGGYGQGEEAALTAVQSLSEYSSSLKRASCSDVKNCIETLIQKTNLEVVALKRKGLDVGTTLAFLYLSEERIYLANLGDSRIYQYSNHQLKRLSVDHNRLQELLEYSKDKHNITNIKGANELTQFLGIAPSEFLIEPHYETLNYSDAIFLLCSDGLTSVVEEDEIANILENPLCLSAETLSANLIQRALENGSVDNITAMVLKIKTGFKSVKGSMKMNNFDPHTLEPFWESWYIDSLIGEGSFGYVYKIYKEEFGKKYYSALKIISLPKSESEAKEVLYESTNQDTATQYFREVAEVIYKEIQIMEELKGKTNIVSFEDHKIISKEDGVGYYILIRMELLTCLNDYLAINDLTISMLYRLATDLCKALQLCKRRNIIHRDIKPANIFVSKDGDFKLGDFGIARQFEGIESGLSIKGTYSYMAPEVYMGNQYDERADIYSLGMVIYYYLNQKHAPFTDANTMVQRYSEKQEALKRRFSGEELPDPIFGSRDFIDVVKKACAYNPEERYLNAEEFLLALEDIKNVQDKVIVKALKMEKDDFLKPYRTLLSSDDMEDDDETENTTVEHQSSSTVVDENDEDEATVLISESKLNDNQESNTKKVHYKNKRSLIFLVSCTLLAGAVVFFMSLFFRDKIQMIDNEKVNSNLSEDTMIKQEVTPVPTTEDIPEPTVQVESPTQEDTTFITEQIDEPTKTEMRDYEVEENGKGYDDFSKIPDIEDVTALTMTDNKLRSLAELENSTNLTYLNLERNKIEDLAGIQKLIKLEVLNLNDNQVTDLSHLKDLISLNTIILSENKVTDLTALSQLSQLRELRISGNKKLKDISVLEHLKGLQVLDLSNTGVEDISSLYQLESLGILNLQNTKISKKQISKLKEKVPNCFVIQ